ncbi:MAG TPA: 6-phosphogluconolactonase [Cyclobacteriaceae bacterium]|nr:6-phosphogluconolactonase [Cyclobacteriaceae bacterium]
MAIYIYKTVPNLIKAMADFVVTIAQNAISVSGEFNIALSGGNSPKRLYEMLSSPDYNQRVEWTKVNFFFGDERYVPAHDPENNSNMARSVLFDPLNIAESNIFSVDTSLSPDEAAKNYSARIIAHFKGKELVFDLILLGLGDNSHTASLFPFTTVLHDKSASVQAVFLQQQNVYRITMTAPMINRARHIAFLVYGQSKAEAVRHVLEDGYDPEKYPAQLIKPEGGNIQWYLGEDAASLLKS